MVHERNEIILQVVFAVCLYKFAYTFCPIYTVTLTQVGFPNENAVNPGYFDFGLDLTPSRLHSWVRS